MYSIQMFGTEDKLRTQIDELQSELLHKQAQFDQLIETNILTQKLLTEKEQRYQHGQMQIGELKQKVNQHNRDGFDYEKRLKNALAMSKRLHIKNEKLQSKLTELDEENIQLRALFLDVKGQDLRNDG